MEPVYAAPHERLLASPSVLEADPLAVVDDVLGSLVSGGTGMSAGICNCVSGGSGGGCIIGGSSGGGCIVGGTSGGCAGVAGG